MRSSVVAVLVALVLLGAACAGDVDGGAGGALDGSPGTSAPPDAGSEEPTATGSSTSATLAPLPPPSRIQLAGPQPGTATCPPVPAQSGPDPHRPVYDMEVEVLLDANAVVGRLTVRFRPDLTTDRLVFRLWPNGPRPAAAGASLEAGPVLVGAAAAATSQPDPTTLVVSLQAAVGPGEEVEATVPWRLTLPGASNDRLAREGETVRLGSFFPILAWEPGLGWATEPATSAFGESSTAPVADFTYSVTVPEGLSVVASGAFDGSRWRAEAMRDVAVSVGRFRTAEAVAHAPSPVAVTVAVDERLDDDAGAYLDRVVGALEDFSRRFGAYPYATHSLALTPGLSGGIEYPGHVMQGPGTLGRTTPHEVGHMWFYNVVGNNQGRDPWLDEGLASWAEARYEGRLEEFRARTVPAYARGRAGEPMTFWENRQDGYYRGVYVQGAQALAALGDPDRVDCALRLYVAANSFTVARPADLVMALRQVLPAAEATLADFGVFP